MLKRIARRWNPEKAIEEAAKGYSKFMFLHNHPSYGASVVTTMTEEWKKTIPMQMDAYETDVAEEDEDGNCTNDGDGDTEIHIPDWEGGQGVILSPSHVPVPTGEPMGNELGWSVYDQANAEFFCSAHFYWPMILAYIAGALEAMDEAEHLLMDYRDEIEAGGDDPARLARVDAALEKLERMQ